MKEKLLFDIENVAFFSEEGESGFDIDSEPTNLNDELTKEEIEVIKEELKKFEEFEQKNL